MLQISSDCLLTIPKSLIKAEYLLNIPPVVEASNPHANVTFPINLRMRREISSRSLLDDFGVIAELWGAEGDIADSASAFQDAFPHMVRWKTRGKFRALRIFSKIFYT